MHNGQHKSVKAILKKGGSVRGMDRWRMRSCLDPVRTAGLRPGRTSAAMLATAEVLTAALNNPTGLAASHQITAYIGSVYVSSNGHDSLQAV